MIIGERLRTLRKQKRLSQGQIEERSGLLRCYVSRVEHGYTVPAMETLEKFARALQVPMYQLFYDGEEPPKPPKIAKSEGSDIEWGNSGKDARTLANFRRLLSHMEDHERSLLMTVAQKLARSAAMRQAASPIRSQAR
jgi:transcriptional regulator with XRE-family HTH domain